MRVDRTQKVVTRHPCHPRRKFASKEQAQVVASKMAYKGVTRHIEPCSRCNGWHVA